MPLPKNIEQIFFEALYGKISMPDFETWLYSNQELESILLPEIYLDLISLGYKQPNVKHEIFRILETLIDKGEYEKWKLLNLLNKALLRNEDLRDALMELYDKYCKGYSFLEKLGMTYGLEVTVPWKYGDEWDELTPEKQQEILDSYYPQIIEDLQQAIGWLESGQITLTGEKGEYNHYHYIDNRPGT